MILTGLTRESTKAEKLTVDKASRLMGKNPMWLRLMLRDGLLPFGTARLCEGGKWTYYISPKLFEEYTGIEVR